MGRRGDLTGGVLGRETSEGVVRRGENWRVEKVREGRWAGGGGGSKRGKALEGKEEED